MESRELAALTFFVFAFQVLFQIFFTSCLQKETEAHGDVISVGFDPGLGKLYLIGR